MKCLYCYKELREGQRDYHPACSRKLFGVSTPPQLPYVRDDIGELAKQVVRSQTTLTGVQAKLSLDVNRGGKNEPDRFTIVGLWGRFILKPQTDRYRCLPEIEDLTMHLAEAARIAVVPHGMIRFADGELCYITRRIDRTPDGGKVAMEDMCQLSERLTEYKYKGSYEKIAKVISRYSSVPQLDIVNYWEVVVFSWLTGNSDIHLKNFAVNVKGAHKIGKNSFTTVPMPRGKLDYASIFKALSDVGYTGVCSFEYERDFTNNLGGLAESVGYARGICDAVTAK